MESNTKIERSLRIKAVCHVLLIGTKSHSEVVPTPGALCLHWPSLQRVGPMSCFPWQERSQRHQHSPDLPEFCDYWVLKTRHGHIGTSCGCPCGLSLEFCHCGWVLLVHSHGALAKTPASFLGALKASIHAPMSPDSSFRIWVCQAPAPKLTFSFSFSMSFFFFF